MSYIEGILSTYIKNKPLLWFLVVINEFLDLENPEFDTKNAEIGSVEAYISNFKHFVGHFELLAGILNTNKVNLSLKYMNYFRNTC